MNITPVLRNLLFAVALSTTFQTMAHVVWLEPEAGKTDQYRVLFGGHEGKTEGFPPEKLTAVQAFSADGNAIKVQRQDQAQSVELTIKDAALILLSFDNGIWTRPATGRTINKPMNEVPGAISAVNAVKYTKVITNWNSLATKTWDQPFEVIPVEKNQPQAGTPLQLQVLIDGKPVAGVKVTAGEYEDATETDANGIATVIPLPGANKIWAGQRIQVADEPRYTSLSVEYLLTFNTKP